VAIKRFRKERALEAWQSIRLRFQASLGIRALKEEKDLCCGKNGKVLDQFFSKQCHNAQLAINHLLRNVTESALIDGPWA
jgi:hypothetical protein